MWTAPNIQFISKEEHESVSEYRNQSMKRAVIMAHGFRCKMCHTADKVEAYRFANTPVSKIDNLEAHIALCADCANRFGKDKLEKL